MQCSSSLVVLPFLFHLSYWCYLYVITFASYVFLHSVTWISLCPCISGSFHLSCYLWGRWFHFPAMFSNIPLLQQHFEWHWQFPTLLGTCFHHATFSCVFRLVCDWSLFSLPSAFPFLGLYPRFCSVHLFIRLFVCFFVCLFIDLLNCLVVWFLEILRERQG